MKNFLIGVLATSAIFVILGFAFSNRKSNTMTDNKWIIAPRFYTLQDGVSKDEARKWIEDEYIKLYREFPGFNCHVGEVVSSSGWGTPNDNYKTKGDFVMVYFFDSKEAEDYYFPPDGGWSDAIVDGIAKHQSTFDELFGKYFIQDKYQNERYMMFARSK